MKESLKKMKKLKSFLKIQFYMDETGNVYSESSFLKQIFELDESGNNAVLKIPDVSLKALIYELEQMRGLFIGVCQNLEKKHGDEGEEVSSYSID